MVFWFCGSFQKELCLSLFFLNDSHSERVTFHAIVLFGQTTYRSLGVLRCEGGRAVRLKGQSMPRRGQMSRFCRNQWLLHCLALAGRA